MNKLVSLLLAGLFVCGSGVARDVTSFNTVLVHHGWFWKRDTPCITGIRYKRIQTALSAGLNLIAYHLPLDAHPELGNNAQIAKRLGIIPEGQWGEMDLGWTGTLSAGQNFSFPFYNLSL